MELYDASINKNNKNRKIYRALIIGMSILVVLIVIILCLIFYLKGTIWTYELNGANSADLKNIVIIDEKDNSKIYIPIRKMAEFVGYSSYRGSYINTSEEDNKCYVKTGNEIAMFEENSNVIAKMLQDSDNTEIEYIEIDEPIIRKNGELCTTINGILNSINMVVSYNNEEQYLKVYTLEYLYNTYVEKSSNYGYESLSDDFLNARALIANVIVGEKDGLYGAYDLSSNSVILENKYKSVTYLSKTDDFLVTDNNGKMGIITREKKNKLDIKYDKVELINENETLYYMVKEDGNIGLIDKEGNIIFNNIASNKYGKIGIDISKFEENGLKNGYVLLNKLIPVQDSKGLWGFVDKSTGQLVIECKYKNLGCINSDKKKENVLVIPSQKVIVVGNGEKYDVITINGEEVYKMALDSVYMTVSGNEDKREEKYYLTAGSQTVDAEENIAKKLSN